MNAQLLDLCYTGLNMKDTQDLIIRNQGTVWQFLPQTESGQAWLEELDAEAWQWLGGTLAVEHRCGADLVLAAQADGPSVGGES